MGSASNIKPSLVSKFCGVKLYFLEDLGQKSSKNEYKKSLANANVTVVLLKYLQLTQNIFPETF